MEGKDLNLSNLKFILEGWKGKMFTQTKTNHQITPRRNKTKTQLCNTLF